LILLHAAKGFTINVVGRVTDDGQQDCHHQTPAKYIHDRREAQTFARALAKPSGRVVFRNIDTAEWSEIPSAAPRRENP
jgi:hypothetical protein